MAAFLLNESGPPSKGMGLSCVSERDDFTGSELIPAQPSLNPFDTTTSKVVACSGLTLSAIERVKIYFLL